MDNSELQPVLVELTPSVIEPTVNWNVPLDQAARVVQTIGLEHPHKISIKSTCCGYIFEMREDIRESDTFARSIRHKINGRGYWKSKYSFLLSLLTSETTNPPRIRVGFDNRNYFLQLMPSIVQGKDLRSSYSTVLSDQPIRVYLHKKLEDSTNEQDMPVEN